MNSSVYISSEKIEVMGYTKTGVNVSVKEYITYPLPEGTVINGKILDQAALCDCLSELRVKHPALMKSVTLTVDGSSILLKRLTVPRLKKNQYYQLVADEYNDSAEGSEELVCDYYPLFGHGEKSAGKAVLACACDKALIESYTSVFKSAGIKLGKIKIGVEAVLNYVNTSPDLRFSTVVLNIIDGFTMLSVIFEYGSIVFISRTRLYGEDNTDIVRNILDNLSGLIQFNKSENFSDITHSYYLGLNEEDLALMNVLNPHAVNLASLDITRGARGAGKLGREAHFVYLNALTDKNGTDLIRSYDKHIKLQRRRRPKVLWPFALLALALVVAAPAVYFSYLVWGVDDDIAELSAYLGDSAVIEKSLELDVITVRTSYYKDILDQLEAKRAQEAGAVSREVFDLITGTLSDRVGVSRIDYNEGTRVIQIQAKGITESDASEYIDALGRSSLVESINYTGYSYTSDGEYSFSISVTLAAKEVLS